MLQLQSHTWMDMLRHTEKLNNINLNVINAKKEKLTSLPKINKCFIESYAWLDLFVQHGEM